MGTLSLPVERECGEGEDRISELPDDIVMSFVSTMGMKEAAKTSILSKRWRYVWAKGTDHLDFNHSIILPDFNEYYFRATRAIKNKYINWVNQVVDLHSSPCINTFRVCFAFERSDAHHIDKWVRFAISKQVKNLELSWLMFEKSVYTLPFNIVKPPSLDVNNDSGGIRFLQSLYLKKINVSGDILEYVLAQCRFLERLHIESSDTLVRLKVVGLCRKLEHLTILYCVNLEQVEIIGAVNLVYLHMGGKDLWSKVVFNNIPNLVDAMFWGPCFSDVAPIFGLNSQLAQISKLSLHMALGVLSAESLPTFCNLKQLTLMVDETFEDELIASINQFLKACPKLCEFKVEFPVLYDDSLYDEAYQLNELDSSNDDDKTKNDVRDWEYFEMRYKMELERKGHPNLREFLVAGFYGCDVDVELILFIVLISCNLETIICDCSHAHTDAGEVIQEDAQVLKSRAAKLLKLIPPKITLAVII